MWHFQSVPAHQRCRPAFGMKRLEALCHAISKRAQRTHPSMAAGAAALVLQKEGEADGLHKSLVKPRYRQRNKQFFFLVFFFFFTVFMSHPLFHLSVSARSLAWVSMEHTHTHPSIHFHCLSHCHLSLSPSCYTALSVEVWRLLTSQFSSFSIAWRCDNNVEKIDMCLNCVDFYAYGWGFLLCRSQIHTLISLSHFTTCKSSLNVAFCHLLIPLSLFNLRLLGCLLSWWKIRFRHGLRR